VTEAEWLACEDPEAILVFLNGRGTDRKQLLAAIHASRSCGHDLPSSALRTSLTICEREADGRSTPSELSRLVHVLLPRLDALRAEYPTGTGRDTMFSALLLVDALMTRAGGLNPNSDINLTVRCIIPPEREEYTHVLRDIFGNPFRPVTFSPDWRTDTAVTLARQMYESRDFSTMPILADALQDAGCDSADILNHCRGPGPHVRGCWVVDLVLGKE
jgi:hypothetical protein